MTLGSGFSATVRDASSGDRDAIERLYRDTVPVVRGYLASQRCRDLDDVVSEVYVSMITSLDRFSGNEDRFRSWLLTIAHRRLMDSYRRTSRRPEDPVEPGDVVYDRRPNPDGADTAIARLEASGVLEAIDQLTEDQRNVVLLRVVADLSVREVARVVGKPESAVKALLRRGLASLQRRLADGSSPVPGLRSVTDAEGAG